MVSHHFSFFFVCFQTRSAWRYQPYTFIFPYPKPKAPPSQITILLTYSFQTYVFDSDRTSMTKWVLEVWSVRRFRAWRRGRLLPIWHGCIRIRPLHRNQFFSFISECLRIKFAESMGLAPMDSASKAEHDLARWLEECQVGPGGRWRAQFRMWSRAPSGKGLLGDPPALQP